MLYATTAVKANRRRSHFAPATICRVARAPEQGQSRPRQRNPASEAPIPSTVKGMCGAMTKPRVTTADRLSNIIEVVELGRRSGLLTVERGSNQTFEEGQVYFSEGRAIYAVVEGLRGRDALSVLAGWGQCRFAFEANAPRPTPNITAPQPVPPMSSGYNGPATGAAQRGGEYQPQRSQPTPARGAPARFNWDAPGNRPLPDAQTPSGGYPVGPRAPQTGPQIGPHTSSLPGGAAGSPFSPAPSSAPSTPSSFGASWPTGWPNSAGGGQNTSSQMNWPSTGGLGSAPSTPSAPTGPNSGFAASGSVSPEAQMLRPRRSPDVRDLISLVSTYNLSRNHRTILLLADGEHTVLDLARLASKPLEEIVSLLAELERLGLVYYY